ncbi:MAG: Bdr protein [Crocosphaera sp.]
MSQSPIKVTYSLEDILLQINGKLDKIDDRFDDLEKNFDAKLDKMDQKFESKLDKMDQKFESRLDKIEEKFESKFSELDKKFESKFDSLQTEVKDLKKEVTDFKAENAVSIESLKGDITALDVEVKGINKRLDSQEFINRSVAVGFILAFLTGVVKLFFPNLLNFPR